MAGAWHNLDLANDLAAAAAAKFGAFIGGAISAAMLGMFLLGKRRR